MQIRKSVKDDLIKFVLEASEEQNSNLATFIAGMQAQKRASKQARKAAQPASISRKPAAVPIG